jgi:Beta protein
MFGHKHYVPILRWKRAERIALRQLHDCDRQIMTPLLELVPRNFGPNSKNLIPAPRNVLAKVATQIGKDWGAYPIFVDLWLLSPMPQLSDGGHPLVFLTNEASSRGLAVIPVTGLSRDAAYQTAVAAIASSDGRGLCLRIHPYDLNSPNLVARVDQLLSHLRVGKEHVDLCLDCQGSVYTPAGLSGLESIIPTLNKWRTFTVASGAFPPNLQDFSIGQHLLPRADWIAWRQHVTARPPIPRLPAYADYTIQCGHFAEPPERANFSASIRYAAHEDWVIMRGEGVFHDGSPGFAQWPANAQMLCGRPEFCGPDFSEGDRYIYEMARQSIRTGGAETWLRAGINHHLTLVARQLASLPDCVTGL